jgi:hypothetical protein
MASARLTRELRHHIITKAMHGFMAAEKADIEARRVALGIELYEHTYGQYETLARQLPAEWLDYNESYNISADGFEHKNPHFQNLDADHLDETMPLGKRRPFPSAGYSRSDDIKVDEKHPLWKKTWKLVTDHRKIVEKESELRQKISSLLHSCNNVKQLENAWPEAMQFVPPNFQPQTTALVPVGLSDQINKALGLPDKSSAVAKAVRKAASTS